MEGVEGQKWPLLQEPAKVAGGKGHVAILEGGQLTWLWPADCNAI